MAALSRDQEPEIGVAQQPNQTPPAYPGDNKAVYNGQPGQMQHQNLGQVVPQQQNMSYQPGGTRMVARLDSLGDMPQDVDCPYCQRQTRTRVEQHASTMTILAGVLVGVFCICLAWIPCAAHFAYDREWYCGNCGAKLAYKQHESSPVVLHPQQSSAYPSAAPPYSQQQQQQQQQQQGVTQ